MMMDMDMDKLTREDFERLAGIKSQNCISIFIPTHNKGMEVNEGLDWLQFKNQLTEVRDKLLKKNYQEKYVTELLAPAFNLLNDTGFWHLQDKGLAVFMNDENISYFRLPVSFEAENYVGNAFVLDPLFIFFREEGKFYTLALSQKKVKLFRNSRYHFEEISLPSSVPQNIDEILSQYEFTKRNIQGKNVGGGTIFHSHTDSFFNDQYALEFFRQVNTGVNEALRDEEKLPLVLFAVDNMHSVYQKANSYPNLFKEGVNGNPDHLLDEEIFEKSMNVMRSEMLKPLKKKIDTYNAFAGTGKTSYAIDEIVREAQAGRIDTLFIEKNNHLWGTFNEQSKETKMGKASDKDSTSLTTKAAAFTIENGGFVYEVSAEEMPEAGKPMVAVFRF